MDEHGRLSPAWIITIYGSAAVLSIAAAMQGFTNNDDLYLIAGLIAFVLTLTTLPICLANRAKQDPGETQTIELDRIRAQIRSLSDTMSTLNETIILSDDARRVLNRRKERDLLCKAIEEDIKEHDWDAAMVLVRELAERFGYRVEAEQFRTRIESARAQTHDRAVHEAIRGLDELIAAHKWEPALSEAARISRVFHDAPQVDGLRHRVISARDRHKQAIERRFLEAARNENIEDAMDLLHEMDHLLSEHEAEQFREVARGVIGKARENLGVEFKLAVQDKAWNQAASVGERIIKEFPNSRMANEVRSMIDQIRDRASTMRS
ncbi:MAG: hypothetical protein KDA29_13955 [Phycisphaerales bacterium]|nr:hypothetical protein [Phycisphaerales bacterium]